MAGRTLILGLLAAALALVGAMPVVAGEPAATVSISSVTIPVGKEGFAELRALIVESQIVEAWTLDVTWDPNVVDAVSCTPGRSSACSPNFVSEADAGRVTGADKNGLSGDVVLARFRFQCAASPGTTPLTIAISVFARSTIPEADPLEVEVQNGQIVCAEAAAGPEQAPTPGALSPPAVGDLPSTGTGGGSQEDGVAWTVVGLAIAVALAALGAGVRLRR